jgi:hypothetical protein
MIFLFYFQLNIDDVMKRINAMEKSMVRFCFSVCSYTVFALSFFLLLARKTNLEEKKLYLFIQILL